MSLTLVTYNIFCRQPTLFKDAQKERCKLIPKTLHKFNPNIDVILIQEIFDERAERKLDKEMKKYGFTYQSRKVGACTFLRCQCFCGRIEDGGIKTYSKYPINNQESIIFQNYEGDKIAEKGCLWTRILKDGEYYNIFNTHLEAGNSETDKNVRFAQMQEISNFIKDLNIDKNEFVILGGDINMDVRAEDFGNAEQILRMKPISLDESTFNKIPNEMQIRDNPGQEHTKEQSQIDLFLIHDYYKKPIKNSMIFTNLKSEQSFKIKTTEKQYKNCPLTCCNELWRYGNYVKMTSLSDHEPRLAIINF